MTLPARGSAHCSTSGRASHVTSTVSGGLAVPLHRSVVKVAGALVVRLVGSRRPAASNLRSRTHCLTVMVVMPYQLIGLHKHLYLPCFGYLATLGVQQSHCDLSYMDSARQQWYCYLGIYVVSHFPLLLHLYSCTCTLAPVLTTHLNCRFCQGSQKACPNKMLFSS